jgi:hypothetical protein
MEFPALAFQGSRLILFGWEKSNSTGSSAPFPWYCFGRAEANPPLNIYLLTWFDFDFARGPISIPEKVVPGRESPQQQDARDPN